MKKVLSTAAALGFCLYLPVAAMAGGPAAPVASNDAVARELQDLRAQLASQQAEIDMLKGQKVAGPVDLSAEQARLDALEKFNWVHAAKKKVDVTLYGQVNKAVMWADDGNDDDIFFVDNPLAGTRLGVTAKSKLNDEFSVGGQLEFEWTQNNANAVNMDKDDTPGSDAKHRQMRVWGQSKTAGKLTLGHGSTAADGSTRNDLSGTLIAGRADGTIGGGIKFSRKDNSGYGPTVGSVFNDLSGGRKDGLRYDSPSFAGVTLSGTVAEGNYNDVAIGYNQKFGDTQVKAGLAYSIEGGSAANHSRIAGSASVMLPFGLNFTVAAGENEFQAYQNKNLENSSFWYGKVGYQLKALSFGSTSFSGTYGQYDDMNAGTVKNVPSWYQSESTLWGAEMVQKFDAINTEFYMAYRLYELEDNVSVTDFDNVTVLLSGARLSF
ncbi:MAG: hypothetical protein K0A99_11995 [Desulfoarculaceae bacterium]|nr:hypothetical protein [Desulfoarculaceae bacterium]